MEDWGNDGDEGETDWQPCHKYDENSKLTVRDKYLKEINRQDGGGGLQPVTDWCILMQQNNHDYYSLTKQ